MTSYRLIHQPTGRAVAVVARAEGWWAKGWGVLGRRDLPPGAGLWLPGVASIHTVGVRFSMDLLFLDDRFHTVRTAPNTPPGCWLVRAAGACHTLELGVGTLAENIPSIRTGEVWQLIPSDDTERSGPAACFDASHSF